MGKHEILYLTSEDLKAAGVGDMKAAMDAVETTFRLVTMKDALIPHKAVMEWPEDKYGPQNRINSMPGYLGGDINMAGMKWIGSNVDNVKRGMPRASGIIILNDPDTKLPLCIMDATDVSAMRTGASGGLGIKYLSRKDSRAVLLMGCGVQGRTQLMAAHVARPDLETYYVYDIYPEKAEQFAREVGAELGVHMVPVTDPKAAAKESDIIITVTVATSPVVFEDMIRPGCTYIHMGGPECTYGVVRMADKRVFDNWDSVLHRGATSMVFAYQAGVIGDEDIYGNLGEIIAGLKPGRERDDEFIFYGACGMGVTDIAVGTAVYRRALEKKIGTFLPYR